MRDIDDDYPTLDVFDAIHRELVTIIGHCTFHRSVLQDLILRNARTEAAPEATLEQWRDESLASVQQLRFSELNKHDKELSAAVYDEASRIAETFWNIALSRAQQRDRVEPGDSAPTGAPTSAAAHDGAQEPLDATVDYDEAFAGDQPLAIEK